MAFILKYLLICVMENIVTYFLQLNECFCYYIESKVLKNVRLGYRNWFKCEQYPTLILTAVTCCLAKAQGLSFKKV